MKRVMGVIHDDAEHESFHLVELFAGIDGIPAILYSLINEIKAEKKNH